ncbi:MAG: short-chain dehydrogenase [Novosphingobium sp.]|uniref:Short chain dehydrogenase n=1 Tax=Novosphingobium indicum TaxID=462949 RepID=A0ABQ2JNE2_9SPHN|nr:SDR family oxidoreductase [Novosphingobium indicum]MAC59738.1 short-chain dehydrogenase [Novosphingobium sp.]GGN48751.1 short chain dehydrogenase [Novosphingobium indicum]
MSEAADRKVAFVTGAASGIGRATAEAFVAAGYATALVDRDPHAGARAEAELQKLGTCRFIACDVTDDASVASAVAQTVEAYGRLDAAFNAAGIDGEHGKRTAECTLENWNRVLAVDLTGTFHCVRHQIPAMLQSGGGAIVNCASVAGLVGAATFAAYVSAKHGVVGLTKVAALEYARENLTVNAICPGTINTQMNQNLPKELLQGVLDASPMGRLGEPSEIAATALFLCSEGGRFINGQAIAVDGGWITQ